MNGVTVRDNTQNEPGAQKKAFGVKGTPGSGGAGGVGGSGGQACAGQLATDYPQSPRRRDGGIGTAGSDGAPPADGYANGGGIYNASGLTLTGCTVKSKQRGRTMAAASTARAR